MNGTREKLLLLLPALFWIKEGLVSWSFTLAGSGHSVICLFGQVLVGQKSFYSLLSKNKDRPTAAFS
jgi:hypothetical protein